MDSRRMIRNIALVSALLLTVFVTSANVALPANSLSSAQSPALAHFTSQGHVLGFAREAFFVSNSTYALHVRFINANAVAPVSETATETSRAAAPPLSRVTYANLWDGITLGYDAPQGTILRSTYTLAPFADVAAIQLRYNAPVTVNADGTLSTRFQAGQVTEAAPIAWQELDGARVAVEIKFVARGEHEVGFALGAYERNAALVIDPVMTWNTFLGGKKFDSSYGITVDASGSVYVAGRSWFSWGSPVRAYTGDLDAFVAKLDANGELLWNTFLGGSGADGGTGIGLDGSGNIYVVGWSSETWGTPLRAYTANFDGFAAKLDPSGALTWHTFLGGTERDNALEIVTDASGHSYVTGLSNAAWGAGECVSCPIRAYTGALDAFAAKLDSGGGLTWNTFLGGGEDDDGYGVAVDASGNVYVSGSSNAAWGTPVRAYSAQSDAYAAKLGAGGALVWNTFLGSSGTVENALVAADASGNHLQPVEAESNRLSSVLVPQSGAALSPNGAGFDNGYGIAVDGSGNMYVSGSSDDTWGTPLRPYTRRYDGFVAKLDSSGELTWNTFLGGSKNDFGRGIALDSSGNPHITGRSDAGWGAPVRPYTSKSDAYAAKLDSSGGLAWDTFLGGSEYDSGWSIAVDGSGNVHVTGSSTTTWSSPVRPYTTGNVDPDDVFDGFVAKIPAVTGCAEAPDKPSLIKPVNKKSAPGPSVKLDWGDAACATKYKVVVRQGSETGTVVFKKGRLIVSTVLTTPLTTGVKYFWQVTAMNAFGSTESSWFSFKVK